MIDLIDEQKAVFKKYARPVVHMRKQIELNRFGLVFGAGISKPLNLPMWDQLVDSIANDKNVDGTRLIKHAKESSKSLPYQIELLMQHFQAKRARELKKPKSDTKEFKFKVLGEWFPLVAKHLYKKAPKTNSQFMRKLDAHPYMKKLLSIVRQTPLTITYNFDNFVERALSITRDEGDKTLGYEVVTNSSSQFRRKDSVIYHPNGYYPPEVLEAPVDNFVFSESSYSEHFLGIFNGNHNTLLNHFSKNTCLFIGLSLDDELLRNILVMSANSNPGNYHYYIHYVPDGGSISNDEKEVIKRTNFKVHNLITLFMGNKEIEALASLLDRKTCTDDEIKNLGDKVNVPSRYFYYMTGPIGVGKSTTVSQYRNLVVLDEWIEERPKVLSKPWDSLSSTEKEEADDWIMNQFYLKNDKLRHATPGIYLVDRPPLDPLAFTKKSETKDKAKRLLETICDAKNWKVKEGVVILLTGSPKELSARVQISGREKYTVIKLEKMQTTLESIYNINGRIKIDTQGRTIPEVIRRVGEIIHLDDYKPCALHQRLQKYQSGAASLAKKR